MTDGPQESLVGHLLVATPVLGDPNFDHTVVLVLDDDPEGSLGVVLNRPTRVPVRDILPAWAGQVAPPQVVFAGGPVAGDSALAVAAVAAAAEPVGFRRLHGALGLVDLDTPPEVLAGGLQAMRVFAGYAGWSPRQLAAEVAEGAWYVVDALPGDPFSATPLGLWRDVLRRQGGDLAFVSTFPDDPRLN